MTIVLPVRTRRVRRRRDAAWPDDACPHATGQVPRVARMLALAHHWRGLIRDGVARDQADLARLVGVSRARVSQVMGLLYLAPDIQDALLMGSTTGAANPIAHCDVLRVAALPSWEDQRKVWSDV